MAHSQPFRNYQQTITSQVSKIPKLANVDPAIFDTLKSKVPPEILAEISQALAAYKSSSEGQAFLAAVPNMSESQLIEGLGAMVRHAAFGKTLSMVASPQNFDLTLPEVFGSFTITIGFDFGFGFGLAAGLGYAVDPTDLSKFSLVIWGRAEIKGGEDIEIIAEAGLTAAAPQDQTGPMVGISGDVATPIGGVAGSIACGTDLSFSLDPVDLDFSNWAVSVGGAAGEGGDISVFGNYTWVFATETVPPIGQPDAPNYVRLASIQCIKRNDTSDHDEITVGVKIDGAGDTYIFPTWKHYSIAEGETWYPGMVIRMDSDFKITLYESDESLDSWTVNYSDVTGNGGSFSVNINNSGVFTNDLHYVLTFKQE